MEAQLLEAVEAIRPALQADGGDMRVVNLDGRAHHLWRGIITSDHADHWWPWP